MNDQDFIRMAIEVGNKTPAPYNFGAVVVKDGNVISAEHNHVHEKNDPSLHAETCAISAACKKLGSNHIEGAVLYASHEPCLMCFSCASWASIDRIVYVIPANEQGEFAYELKTQDLQELSKQLVRPMKIERLELEN